MASWGEIAGHAPGSVTVIRGPVLTARFLWFKVTFVVLTAILATPDGVAVFTGESSSPPSLVLREGPIKAKGALARALGM